jgi:hypothetical protein
MAVRPVVAVMVVAFTFYSTSCDKVSEAMTKMVYLPTLPQLG